MVTMRISLFLLLASLTYSWAFVEQLHPHTQQSDASGIPCHAMGAILRNFAEPGGPTPSELGAIMVREWVPGGWVVPRDTDDNTALVALMGPMSTDAKRLYASFVEDMCILWEMGVDEVDTPAKFRTRIGIAP